jgi:DNA-directed RNA polymerase subunit K/omega
MDKDELQEVVVSDSDNESNESVKDKNENDDIDSASDSEIENDDEIEDIEDDISDDDDDVNEENVNIINRDIDDDDDDDDDLEEDYLKKLNKDVHNNILQNYHPELAVYNNEEIKASCVITRDSKGNIIDPLHKTLPFITNYEKTRIIGERAKQINEGAEPLVEVDKSIIDGYLIALKEYEEKKIPFIIQRPLPNGTSEYWKVSDLEYLE